MMIKVLLLTVLLMFLWLFPSMYTLFYYYRRDGKLTNKAHNKAWYVFGIVFLAYFILGLFILASVIIIKILGW